MKTLEFKDKDKIYFTSDLHLGHENIVSVCKRPFDSVDEMDKIIMEIWNNTVADDDTIFILGDFCWRMSSKAIYWYLTHLRGNKILILGNHDRGKFPETLKVYDGFINIKIVDPDGMDGVEKGYQRLTLCHYPMLSWYQSHRGAWQLFGHWHNTKVTPQLLKDRAAEFEIKQYVKEEHLYMDKIRPTQYDVGVDGNDFMPIAYNRIKEIIKSQIKKH